MTTAPDPLDLPILAVVAPAARPPGRVRSSFDYGGRDPDPAGPNPIPGPAARHWEPTGVTSIEAHQGPLPSPSVRSRGSVDWRAVPGLRAEVSRRLADQMGEARWDRATQESEGRELIRKVLEEDTADAIARVGEIRSLADQEALAQAVFDACFGLGRLQPLVDDDTVENIMITGCDRVLVERADGTIWRADAVSDTDEELVEFLGFLAARADNPRSFTPSQPSLHLTLPGGSRLAAARDTARVSVVIRRHRVRQVTLDDMVTWGSLSAVTASFLRAAVKARLSIVVSGDQGAGKTTLLRALCAEIDPSESIGTFESEFELFLHEMPEQHHSVHAWEVREGSGERAVDGRVAGSRTTAEQIVDSFRFNLRRQILGEIRGPEVWSMVKLMESGSGSISTTHSASASQTMRKLITCAMEAGPQISQELAATKLADTVDLVVHIACDIETGPAGAVGRKHRYVEEILQVTPGERPRGYATNVVFGRVPGDCAVAHTRPDALMDALVAHGFDTEGFELELGGRP